MKHKNKPDRDTLYRLYVEEFVGIPKLAKMFGRSYSTAHRWLVDMGIDRRTQGDTRLGKNAKRLTYEELYGLYITDGLSTSTISDVTGVGNTTIGRWLKKYGIKTRSISETRIRCEHRPSIEELVQMYVVDKLSTNNIGNKYNVSARAVWQWLTDCGIKPRNLEEAMSIGKRKPSRDELYRMYVVDNMSTIEIGENTGFEKTSISRWLKEYGIEVRSVSEALMGKWVGEKSFTWRGGSRGYCHKFNEVFKESIREEFGRTCFICGKSEESNGRKLDVHHTNYAKMCMCGGMDCRFVPLCKSCHAKTNHDRHHWFSYIMRKLLLESSAQYVTIDLYV